MPLVLLAISFFSIAACSGGGSTADQAIQNDFRRYISQLSSVTDLEAQGNEANKKAVSEPGANDATYGAALRDTIIPKLVEFEHELARIHPTTDEILGLHKILLRRARLEVAGYKGLEQASREAGDALIERANAQFAEAKIYYERWSQQMDDLSKRYSKSK